MFFKNKPEEVVLKKPQTHISFVPFSPMRIPIGIDLSLKSPAVAIYINEQWRTCAFVQRLSDRQIDHPSITLLDPIPTNTKQSDIVRYVYITTKICDFIRTVIIEEHHFSLVDVDVFIEGYVFNQRNCGSSFKLHELGGICKYALYTLGILQIWDIHPSTWKKYTVGTRASKSDTISFVKNCIDLVSVFGITELGQNPPCPVHDIADAIGIVEASRRTDLRITSEQKTNTRKRKRHVRR